jgi:WD40 repeat protein
VKLWNIDQPSDVNVFGQRTRGGQTVFSADGRFLAAEDGNDVAIWDLGNSNVTHSIKGGGFAFSSNTIAVISPTKRLEMWSLDPVTRIARPCDAAEETNQWSAPAFSPRGDRFAAISGGNIHVWAVPGWNLLAVIKAHSGQDWLLFLPDGESVLTESNNEITRWQIGTGKCVGSFGPAELTPSVSSDGRVLATIQGDTVHRWEVATGVEIDPHFKGRVDAFASVAFSPDGNTIAAATFDGPIQLWNVACGQLAGTLQGPLRQVGYLAFSPDGTLVSNGWDNTIRLWKAPAWSQIDSGNFPR